VSRPVRPVRRFPALIVHNPADQIAAVYSSQAATLPRGSVGQLVVGGVGVAQLTDDALA
jgi:hypothetical protein